MSSIVQKVLIVDDSQTNLALLAHMLRDVGCEVLKAESGMEAVSLVKEHEVALILLDIQMPGMNGYETAAKIKDVKHGRHVPIIFITAIFQDEDNVRQGYETGAVDYLFRPVDMQILTSKVQAFLKMHEQKVLLEEAVELHRKTVTALQQAEEKYRSIFERVVEGLFQCTMDGEYLEVNPAFARILGYINAEELVGKTGLHGALMVNPDERRLYEAALEKHGAVSGFEFQARQKDGNIIWCSESSRVVYQENMAPFVEGIIEDITDKKTNELELKRLATVDSLTGIANRHKFFDRLEHALALAKRYDQKVAVLFVDLNEFKKVNDTFGHQMGDDLLRLVAQRLESRIRESDTLARLGGDEFGILITGAVDEVGAVAMTRSLLDEMNRPFSLSGEDILIGATIGMSFYPDDGKDCVSLISRADAAMYGAKKENEKYGTFVASFEMP
ncbi:diguanylate cyclase [Pseudodesulfovibrio sp. JC047]|uniref:two-component system response regulator n=1 Tax=Pseudodesulfovibrio sp. JC047 TaxID=2683199 RepID=UPI0013D5C88A|nr:diguanylate cyclase [Pseudodesulfovibrio sp. JC047]NDV18967.1 diguanylate cyclase [Pseudodesulfovibrio sp. JC047]